MKVASDFFMLCRSISIKTFSALIILLFLLQITDVRASESTVTRSFSDDILFACSTLTVSLEVSLNSGTLDESVPSDWAILDSDGGDTSTAGHIIWATPALDSVYSYTLQVPCSAKGRYSINGTYLFEGNLNPIAGETNVHVLESYYTKSEIDQKMVQITNTIGDINSIISSIKTWLGFSSADDFCDRIGECGTAQCGNSIKEFGEECDDGNIVNGDGCSSTCKLELPPTNCGNNIKETGETCELPNTHNNEYCIQDKTSCSGNKQKTRDTFGDCNALCGCSYDPFSLPACNPGTCNAQCAVDSDCASQEGFSKRCNLDTCLCEYSTVTICGNGQLDLGEQCDDGNRYPYDGCTNLCKIAVCGDGIIHQNVEECDDGNLANGDGCDSTCHSERQKICTAPVDAMLVIDRSGSMATARLPDAKSAAITFINSMNFSKDKAGLTSFSTSTTLDKAITSDKASIISAITALVASGNTDLGDGVKIGKDELLANGTAKRFMIILSDGAPNAMTLPNGSIGYCFVEPTSPTACTAYSLEQAQAAKAAGIEIFTIGLGVSTFTEELLKEMATNAAHYFFAPDSSVLESIYIEISQNLCPCGNGLPDPGEQCDDGNNYDYDTCTNQCKSAFCGDHILELGVEECDDGNNLNNDGCSATCRNEVCGDGIKQANEQCDDGNIFSGDGCSSLCITEYCGDSIIQEGLHEQCDDGNQIQSDLCANDCTLTICGDGILQKPNGLGLGGPLNDGTEECDDENVNNNDACVGNCVIAKCGDGYVWTGVEQCDDGNLISGDGCTTNCKAEYCGDAIVQAGLGEKCELPNTGNNNNCPQTPENCSSTKYATRDTFGNCDSVCGCKDDSFVFSCVKGKCGATCGNNNDCANNSCQTTYTDSCEGVKLVDYNGDKIMNTFNKNNTCANTCTGVCSCTNCATDCSATPLKYCVIGLCGAQCLVDANCSDGDIHTQDICTGCLCSHVPIPYCGDGITNQGEQCDDGVNHNNSDRCYDNCTFTKCGDGIIQLPNGQGTGGLLNNGFEECDDGNAINQDGCSTSCFIDKKPCIAPLDIMLVIDKSGSMNGERLTNAKSASKTFVSLLNSTKDRSGLASFNQNAVLNIGLTSDKALVSGTIDALTAGGNTNIGDGIKTGKTELLTHGGNNTFIVLLSDGAPNAMPLPNGSIGYCYIEPSSPTACTIYSLDQANAAKAAGIEIFTIGLNVTAFTQDLLKQIASNEHNYFFAPGPSDLESIYRNISLGICPQ
jgi:cysteine-rich repeat protein